MVKKSASVMFVAPLKKWGGLESDLVNLGKEFIRWGVSPELLCIRGGDIPYPERMPEEFKVSQLKTRSKIDGVPKLAKLLRRNPPGALITLKDHSAQIALAARALSRVPVPIYVRVTSTLSIAAHRPMKRYMIRKLYPRADRVIAISKGVAKDLVDNFSVPSKKIAVLYNPVVTEDFVGRSKLQVYHPWLQRGFGVPVVMGAGRLDKTKDFTTLLEAFCILRSRKKAKLIILGDGAERHLLERRVCELGIAGDVDFPGQVDDILPYVSRANVFALSSKYEGLGNVLVEAMAVGTPVVSTDCPHGPREILMGGLYGSLVPVGDSRGLANAMLDMLDNPLNRNNFYDAIDRFRSERVAEEYLQVMGFI